MKKRFDKTFSEAPITDKENKIQTPYQDLDEKEPTHSFMLTVPLAWHEDILRIKRLTGQKSYASVYLDLIRIGKKEKMSELGE